MGLAAHTSRVRGLWKELLDAAPGPGSANLGDRRKLWDRLSRSDHSTHRQTLSRTQVAVLIFCGLSSLGLWVWIWKVLGSLVLAWLRIT
jgi:hypothetical protein